jgi:hypothetical protein
MTTTRTQVTVALAAAALFLAIILGISPHATIVAGEASSDIYGIDILGITKAAQILPDQQFPTH